jgi:hypothetical protein
VYFKKDFSRTGQNTAASAKRPAAFRDNAAAP